MLEKFRPGHHVQVTIVNVKTYIGEVSFVNQSFDRIYLKNVIHLMSATEIDHMKFYKSEITSIQFLKHHHHDTESSLTMDELMKLGKMINNYNFIERFDVKYHNAIDDISMQSFIGLYIVGVESGRFSTTLIFVISTESNIYLFDILVMGRIEKRLKSILEANEPKKIVHDSNVVADHLQRQDIVLSSVFDAMVAHVALGYDKSRLSLRESLRHHLNIPTEFLETLDEWYRRPLSSVQKRNAAQFVMFLRKLHFKLTRVMLSEIYSLSNQNLYLQRIGPAAELDPFT